MGQSLRWAVAGAAILGGSAASAADLPGAEPAEFVRVCEPFGTGFFYIPGTDTCLRTSGYARFEIYAHENNIERDDWEGDPFALSETPVQNDTFNLYTRGLLRVDARTQTGLGTLRSFIVIRGSAVDQDNPGAELDMAYLQFAGFTAGLAPSYFQLASLGYIGQHFADLNDEETPLLAYTYETPDELFDVTVAIESQEQARLQDFADIVLDGRATPSASAQNNAAGASIPGPAGGFGVRLLPERTEAPFFVGQTRYKPSWGEIGLSGAVGQVKSTYQRTANSNGTGATVFEDTVDEIGYAVSGSLTLNLPFPDEKATKFVAKGAYSDGATFYTLGNNDTNPPDLLFDGIGALTLGELRTVEFVTAFGGFETKWTDKIRTVAAVSYLQGDLNGSAGLDEVEAVNVTLDLRYDIVKNLYVAGELLYSTIDAQENVVRELGLNGDDADRLDEDGFGFLLRVQRDFGS